MVRTFTPLPYKIDSRTPIQKMMGDPPAGRSAADADKVSWTKWVPGSQHPAGLIDVKRQNGQVDRCVLARDQNWRHEGWPDDIVAYRAVEIGRGGST